MTNFWARPKPQLVAGENCQIALACLTAVCSDSCLSSRELSNAILHLCWGAVRGLIALLLFRAAPLEEAAPPIVTSERQGLPKPWHPAPIQVLPAEPAPSPNMTSEAVLAAQPKA